MRLLSKKAGRPAHLSNSVLKSSLLLTAGLSVLSFGSVASAQDTFSDAETLQEDTVTVTGTRQVIQDSIALKRDNTQIVDGLSANEIGDIPSLSIGEALENLTGAASHIENGGATEISIRGLGPFLSSTVFNGRAATNGSGDRSVNFSQFPSELLSKVAIYKTQDASLVEGGIAGQIHLDTVRPLDFGKRRIQGQIKGNINPDQLNIDDSEAGDIGYRGTLSYIDQYELPGGGRIGLSVGGQLSRISAPEQEVRSTSPQSSSNLACLVGSEQTQGFTNADVGDDDCEDQRGTRPDGRVDGFDTTIDPATGLAVDAGEEFAFVGSQRGFRQNDTLDTRDSLFGALQFQPNDRWDINIDGQYSKRTQEEDRFDITFDNSRRNSSEVTVGNLTTSSLDSLILNDTGGIQQIAQQTDLSLGGEQFIREEEYLGGGFNVSYDITDRLTGVVDLSYSRTTRTELQTSSRVQSNNRQDVLVSLESGIPLFTIDGTNNFNVNDADGFETNGERFFDDGIRLRIDNDVDRENEILGARLDFNYDVSGDILSSIDVGGRYSELTYVDLISGGASTGNGFRTEIGLADGTESIYDCETAFAETNFLSSLRSDGENLFTFVDSDGSVISTSNNFTTFDNACFASAVLAGNGITSDGTIDGIDFGEITRNTNTIDVTEETFAGYVKANFDTDVSGYRVSGNAGLRVVNTDVSSLGFRDGFTVESTINAEGEETLSLAPTGNLEIVEAGGSYTELLPSLNVNVELRDDIILRGAVFRGLTRIDPSDLNNIRALGVQNNDDEGEAATELADLINPTASGTPDAEAFTSWNFDAAVEWYPNADSLLTFGAYYKRFRGGFDRVSTTEEFTIDGLTQDLPIVLSEVTEDQSNLFGIEISAAHRFSYLPGFLSGFGVKGGYNFADSNFEFEDSDFGDQFTRVDGELVQSAIGIVDPANIQGLSKHVLNTQLYYQIGDFDLSGTYKYRSQYFQPFTGDGTVLRFVEGRGTVDVRAAYKVNSNFRATLEILNILGEERVDTFRTTENFGQANAFGPRIFFGLRGRF